VTKSTMGLKRLCANLGQHPVKAHTRHLFQDPSLTWFVLAPKSARDGTLKAGAAHQLYPRSTSAKNPLFVWRLQNMRLHFTTRSLLCNGQKEMNTLRGDHFDRNEKERPGDMFIAGKLRRLVLLKLSIPALGEKVGNLMEIVAKACQGL